MQVDDWTAIYSTLEASQVYQLQQSSFFNFHRQRKTTNFQMQLTKICLLLAAILNSVLGQDQYEWKQLGVTLKGTEDDAEFGRAVATSADGSIVAIGSPGQNSSNGAVRMY